MTAHALLGASSGHCWGTCVAAPRAQKGLVDRGSRDADEGSAVHELGAWSLQTGKHPSEYPETHIQIGDTAWRITKEMVDNVVKYVDRVRTKAEGGTLLVEQRVTYGPVIFGPEPMTFPTVADDGSDTTITVRPEDVGFGTSDAIYLHPEVIGVEDYKNGANPNNIVEADNNEQLLLYLIGALYEYGMLGDFKRGAMGITQPRLKHYPDAEIDIVDLEAFAAKIGAAGKRALELYYRREEPEMSDYTPGSACKWCKRKATCPALYQEVETETRDLFAALVENGASAMAAAVPEDRLAQAMEKVGLLEDFTKAIRAETERRLLAGHPVPGFKLVEGRKGARKWTSDEEAEAVLKSMRLKTDEMYDYSVKSPTSIEKVLKDNPRRWTKLQELISRSDGKPSVAPESDKRPALAITSVTDSFAALAVDPDPN